MYNPYTLKYSPCFFTYPPIAQIKGNSSLQKPRFTILLQTGSLFVTSRKVISKRLKSFFVSAGLTE